MLFEFEKFERILISSNFSHINMFTCILKDCFKDPILYKFHLFACSLPLNCQKGVLPCVKTQSLDWKSVHMSQKTVVSHRYFSQLSDDTPNRSLFRSPIPPHSRLVFVTFPNMRKAQNNVLAKTECFCSVKYIVFWRSTESF